MSSLIDRFDTFKEQQARKTQASEAAAQRASQAQAAQVNVLTDEAPDAAAEANKWSRQTQAPAAIFDAKAVAEQQTQDMVRNLSNLHPAIGKFLSDPRAAAASKDDIENLARVAEAPEIIVNGKLDNSFGARAQRFLKSTVIGLDSALQADGPNVMGIARDVRSGLPNLATRASLGIAQGAYGGAGSVIDVLNEYTPLGRLDSMRKLGTKMELTASDAADARERLTPEYETDTGRQVTGGLESAAQNITVAAATAFNPVAALIGMGEISGGQSAYEAKRAGLSPIRSLEYGVRQGGIEAATEAIPTLKLFGDLKAGTPFFKTLTRNIAAEVPGEQAATLLQDLNEWSFISSNKGKTFSDYLAERPAAAWETLVTTVAAAGAMTASAKGVDALAKRADKLIVAAQGETALTQVMDAASASKLRARDPEMYRQFIDTASEDTPVENVYLPVEAIETYFQSEEFEQLPATVQAVIEQQLDEARATGGDIVIPLSIATDLAGTKAWEAFKEEARVAPGGLSGREAREQGDAITQEIEARGKEIETEAEASPAGQVYLEVKQQLLDSGFTETAADRQAALYAASREAKGAQLGMDALAYHRYSLPLTVERSLEDGGPPTSGTVLDQSNPLFDTILKEAKERKAQAKVLARDNPSGVKLFHADGRYALASTDVSAKGFRLTRFDSEGPSGHTEHATLQEAIDEGLRERYQPSQTFDQEDTLARAQNPTSAELDQSTKRQGQKRGQIALTGDAAIITLFANANMSTFIHETGHLFLEEMKRDAAHPAASDQLKADWASVQTWFKDQGHPIKKGTIPREAHELFARGFERYAMEGKAPSSYLKAAFASFRSWLLDIYQVVANLRSPITPEIREVFDRMLATQDAIAEYAAEQANDTELDRFMEKEMTPAEFVAYRALARDAQHEAYDMLLYKTMQQIKRRETARYKEQEVNVRASVEESVNDQPRHVALHLLRTGRWLNDPTRESENVKLDRAWLVERFGADVIDRLPKGSIIYKTDGNDPDFVAEITGFGNGTELVDALLGLAQEKTDLLASGDTRPVRTKEIDDQTRAIMDARGGSDVLTDGSIEEEAVAAVNNARRGEMIATQVKQLARRTRASPTPYKLAREWAARKIAAGKVVDVVSRAAMQRYSRAAVKAGKLAEEAILAEDIDEAFRQKQAQMLNHALLVEAKAAADKVDTIVARLKKLGKKSVSARVDQDYMDQALALLDDVELRDQSQRAIDRRLSYEAWAAGQIAEGRDIGNPSFAAAIGQTNYTRLAVNDLTALDEAIEQILHLGRLKKELKDGKEAREFATVIKEAKDSLSDLRQKTPSDNMAPSWLERAKSNLRSGDAALLKIEQVIDWLDNGNPNGIFNRIVWNRIKDARTVELDMLTRYTKALDALMRDVPKETVKGWTDPVDTPELINRETGNPFRLTKEQVIAMALNTGNEQNYQRLTARGEGAYGWSREAVQAVLDRYMTEADWKYVQGVWDLIDTLWPELSEMERRVNGIAPPKIEATEIVNQYGTFRGGYYPAIYDPMRSAIVEEQNERSANALFEDTYTRATTRAAAANERVEKVSRPVLLSLSIIQRHIGEVVHDIAFREAIIDADRFLSNATVQKGVSDTLGREYAKLFRPWLQSIANDWANDRKSIAIVEKLFKGLRTRTTIVGLGFRLSTVIQQSAGYANVVAEIGPKWWSVGMARFVAHPIGAYNEAKERSGELRARFDNLDRDIRENARRYVAQGGVKGMVAGAQRFAYYGIGYADMLVVVPAWTGAFNKARTEGMTEDEATRYADKIVRQSQGAGNPEDVAAIMRTNEATRLFTVFYSYFSALYARQRNLGRMTRNAQPRDIPKILATAWWLLVMPNLITLLIKGEEPPEDEDEGAWLARKLLFGNLGSIPGIRDLVSALDSGYGYKTTPVQSVGDALLKSAKDIKATVFDWDDDEDPSGKWLKNSLTTAGYALNLPLGAPGTAAQFIYDVVQGDEDPQGIKDWLEGLQTGKVASEE